MSATRAIILIIEDDSAIRRFLRIALEGRQYGVIESPDATEGLRQFGDHAPEAIVLDLGLPDRDGVEVVKEIRKVSTVPIIIVSARGQESGKIEALDAGADDYLTKPFGVGELLARVRVALRRAAGAIAPVGGILTAGDVSMNLDSREVTVRGTPVHLTPHEYRLLAVLLRNAGKVLTHKQLLKETWGTGYGFETHYVRVYMNQLRKKIEPDSSRRRYIHTETGIGYRFITPE
jgi:two-component system KDP operon response regulator KdpE